MTVRSSHLAVLAVIGLGLTTTIACKDKGDDTGGIGSDDGTGDDGTGTDTDSGATDTDGGTTDCEVDIDSLEPDDGDTGVYWRDPMEVTLDGATDPSNVTFTLTDSGGAAIPVTASWSEGGLVATLTAGDGMTGNETYTLQVDVCGNSASTSFTTSAYGLPLEGDPVSLKDTAFYFDLPGATFVQPPGVGALLATFLDVPIILGITDVSSTQIDLLGAQGERNDADEWIQDLAQVTWDFPVADFGTSPYFEAEAAEIVIGYSYGGDIYEIPVYNFHVEGTFSADGTRIGGGRAIGKGDTRNMGPLLGAGDEPDAVCEFLGTVGLVCEDCGDGNETCITLEALFPEAPVLPGVTVVEILAD
ncbi:MAG: Ig-like domain-containing protein [Alphaproteobacteria bacterium]|nr:Ig-like domain-containing protein [Alphaproteobacteria bacterium]